MSCASNFKIKDTHYININYKIPCRYCLNCRVDRRNEWENRANWEFKNKISGAFVTFTYDNIHLIDILKLGNDNKIRPTLNYKDVKKFIQNIRKYVQKHKEKWSYLFNPNFTYLGVGEYGQNGEIFDRPHFHILFFGLDFKYCEKLFLEKWQKGFIDSLPILPGGIRYVLKYMDKQIKGKQSVWENYTRYGLEEPKQFQSKGLGSELYQEEFEKGNIINGEIHEGLKKIPVPMYYKKKMKLFTNKRENTEKKINTLKNYWKNKKYNNPNKILKEYEYEVAMEKLERDFEMIVKRREENLYQKMINGAKK